MNSIGSTSKNHSGSGIKNLGVSLVQYLQVSLKKKENEHSFNPRCLFNINENVSMVQSCYFSSEKRDAINIYFDHSCFKMIHIDSIINQVAKCLKENPSNLKVVMKPERERYVLKNVYHNRRDELKELLLNKLSSLSVSDIYIKFSGKSKEDKAFSRYSIFFNGNKVKKEGLSNIVSSLSKVNEKVFGKSILSIADNSHFLLTYIIKIFHQIIVKHS